ncbi:MAG TPA: carbamate kinase [Burkholderiales bacterium]|nr:carbamate kinase [Burkholderiales bacterium]
MAHATAIVAVGGNSLIVDEQHQSIPDQFNAAAATSHYVADMVEAGWTVVLTHGNGPQVGFILRRSGIAKGVVPEVPIDYADADTQGAIGYMFQRSLYNEFRRRGLKRKVIALVTQVLVDPRDPAFQDPTKPIGAYMDHSVAESLATDFGWTVKEDAGRGWRRVVASPLPRRIIELDLIKSLIEQGHIVIACGGGGIPVLEDERGELQGLEAVIDKDLASSLLARDLQAELFVISTAVEKVAIHFNQPNERWLDRITLAELRGYIAEGHFAKGSMGPKIEAVVSFLEGAPRGRAIITNPPNLGRALTGAAGTHIVAGG